MMVVVTTKMHGDTSNDSHDHLTAGVSGRHLMRLLAKRAKLVLAQASAMALGWCVLCVAQWIATHWSSGFSNPETVAFRTALALVISIVAFCSTLCLNKLVDTKCCAD